MIMEIYAVKDKQVDAFLQPFFSPTIGSALRSLKHVVNDANHEFSKNVHDFNLFRLGSFDDSSGIITVDDGPVHMIALSQLVEKDSSVPFTQTARNPLPS